jgi:hypothetical protein
MQPANKVNLNDGRERHEPAVPIYFLGPRSAQWSGQEELEFQQSLNAALFGRREAQTDSLIGDESAAPNQFHSDFVEKIAVNTIPNVTLASGVNRTACERLEQGRRLVEILFRLLAAKNWAQLNRLQLLARFRSHWWS